MSLLRPRKKIIFISIAVLLILATAGAYLLPKLTLIIPIKVDYSRVGAPRVYLLPVDRLIRVPEDERVGGVRHVGAWFSFATPFDIEKNYDSEHAQAFLFGNRKSLVVSPQLETERIVKKLLAGESAEARKMKRLLGEENIASEYAALDLCLTTTPEPVRLSSSIQELLRTTLMLILKKAFSGLGDVIYRFSLGETKGFQFGNPATASDVYVYLFNPSDRMFRMKFTSLTQGEIDFFLTSIDFFAPPNRTRPG
ncbi:MAG: hypothetical protein PVG81_07655 [Desulfobacterales bacterium]|jgi:hypothetical protein